MSTLHTKTSFTGVWSWFDESILEFVSSQRDTSKRFVQEWIFTNCLLFKKHGSVWLLLNAFIVWNTVVTSKCLLYGNQKVINPVTNLTIS